MVVMVLISRTAFSLGVLCCMIVSHPTDVENSIHFHFIYKCCGGLVDRHDTVKFFVILDEFSYSCY